MLSIIDRQPISKPGLGLELMIACTPRRDAGEKLDHGVFAQTKAFSANLDTGFTGDVYCGMKHFREYCEFPYPIEDLPGVALRGATAQMVARRCMGYVWLFPGGVSPDIVEPVRLPLGSGFIVLPSESVEVAGVGLGALARIGASVEVDLLKRVFSVRIVNAEPALSRDVRDSSDDRE